ncbi:MAG: hypothetical protein M1389_11895 [Chloroflexi bacterium]|nr:hypothetical protein [Chloroflexota bacterium]
MFSKGSLVTGFLGSIGANLYDYGLGSQSELGLGSREFYVSTGVDFALTMGTGLAAAGTVAGVLALAGAAGLTAVAAAPVGVIVGATAVVGLGMSLVLDQFEVGRLLKEQVIQGLDAWHGVRENAVTIARALPGYVRTTVEEPLVERVSDVGSRIAGFVRGLFGGGGR